MQPKKTRRAFLQLPVLAGVASASGVEGSSGNDLHLVDFYFKKKSTTLPAILQLRYQLMKYFFLQ